MSGDEEARSEAESMQKVVEEKEESIACLEREVKILKQEKAESEMKIRDLELKVRVYEVRLSEERSKRVRVEEEMKEIVGDRDREIQVLKQSIDDFEKVKVWREGESIENEENKGLLFVLPMLVAGSGVIAAFFYFCFRKQRR